MISKKILLISSLVVAFLVSSCSPGNSDNTAEIKAEPEFSYDPNGPLGFRPDAENFTKFLNTLDWGKGVEVTFSHLDQCFFGGGYSQCSYGFSEEVSPLGVDRCEINWVLYIKSTDEATFECR